MRPTSMSDRAPSALLPNLRTYSPEDLKVLLYVDNAHQNGICLYVPVDTYALCSSSKSIIYGCAVFVLPHLSFYGCAMFVLPHLSFEGCAMFVFEIYHLWMRCVRAYTSIILWMRYVRASIILWMRCVRASISTINSPAGCMTGTRINQSTVRDTN